MLANWFSASTPHAAEQQITDSPTTSRTHNGRPAAP
jgi:hypothetical protein